MNINALLQNSFHILEDFHCIHLKAIFVTKEGIKMHNDQCFPHIPPLQIWHVLQNMCDEAHIAISIN